MKRRTQGILLVGSLAVVATVVVLSVALARVMDPSHYCETGFSKLVSCTFQWSSKSIGQGTPIFTTPSSPPPTFQPSYVDVTLWAVAHCPQNYIAKRLLCAAPSGAAAACCLSSFNQIVPGAIKNEHENAKQEKREKSKKAQHCR